MLHSSQYADTPSDMDPVADERLREEPGTGDERLREERSGEDDPQLWLEDITGDDALEWVRRHNEPTLDKLGGERFEFLRAEALEILDMSDDGPANNWLAGFGGSAWSRDDSTGRWYLHSFYPEQPDLDWRNPAVRAAFGEIVRFWTARGVDGFRVDAIDRAMKDAELRDDPLATKPFGLPLPEEYATLDHVHSFDDPEIGLTLSALRHAAGDALLVGEVYLPTARLARYLEHLDLAFAFEFLHAPFEAARLREVIGAASELRRVAWVLSNHDFPRLATRLGEERAALAAMLLLTLPGTAFIYQGDEIGMVDGPGAVPPIDRAGRDPHRHPMQWEAEPGGGFTTGTPWLPLTDPQHRSVEAERGAPGSMLELYRALIALRRDLRGALELIPAEPDVLAFRRGEHLVALNLGSEPRPLPGAGTTLVETAAGSAADGALAPLGGAVLAG